MVALKFLSAEALQADLVKARARLTMLLERAAKDEASDNVMRAEKIFSWAVDQQGEIDRLEEEIARRS
jgi:hypothetical protein